MRRHTSEIPDRSGQLADLRRVLRAVGSRPDRDRLLRVVDDLERDAGWDQVKEIRATQELAVLRAELDLARAELASMQSVIEGASADIGRARRQRDDCRHRLVELRELIRPELADELVELRMSLEARHPTSPPLFMLGQAARLVRAVSSTAAGAADQERCSADV